MATANDTIYGLNASVFTHDVDRARAVARQLRTGTVGHNVFRIDFGIAFGGFKQSGIGREGGAEGLLPFLETKTVVLEGVPAEYRSPAQEGRGVPDMDLNPTEEQQQLIDTFGAFYAKECPVERVRGAEPSGHDPELWTRLREVGALDMAVDEASGGWGASLLDLALGGRAARPSPRARTADRGAGRSPPARSRRWAAAADALGRAHGEGRLITFGSIRRENGLLTMVPAGAVADEVVFLHRDRLRCMTLPESGEQVREHRLDAGCRPAGRSDRCRRVAGERAPPASNGHGTSGWP